MENRPNRPTRLAVLARLIGERKRGLMMRHDRADHEDQHEKAEIFLQHHAASAPAVRWPTASRSTFCSLNCAALEEAADRALVHHRDAVADADHLLHVAGDHQDGDAARRRARASARRSRSWRRRRCRASARRRSSRAGVIDSHLASTTFCWLPPDSVPTSVVDAGRAGCRGGGAAARRCARLGAAADEAAAAKVGEVGQRDVLGDRESSSRPERLRSSGTR